MSTSKRTWISIICIILGLILATIGTVLATLSNINNQKISILDCKNNLIVCKGTVTDVNYEEGYSIYRIYYPNYNVEVTGVKAPYAFDIGSTVYLTVYNNGTVEREDDMVVAASESNALKIPVSPSPSGNDETKIDVESTPIESDSIEITIHPHLGEEILNKPIS